MVMGSVVLGFLSWTFGMVANARRSVSWMYASFVTCLIGALLPFYELRSRFTAGDYGGAEDILGGILFGEWVLICVTVLINGIALVRMKKAKSSHSQGEA